MDYAGFIGGFDATRAGVQAIERTVNFYVEPSVSRGAKTAAALYPTPGLRTFATHASKNRVRAMFEENGRCFAVIEDTFVEVLIDGTMTDRGTVVEGGPGSPATIVSNGDGGDQLFVVSGDRGYVYDLTANTLTEILGGGATQAAALDGFVFVLDETTSTIKSSDLFNAGNFRGAAYEQRNAAPDPWLAVAALDRLLYAFGERTSDLYYNAGGANFPFALHTAGAFPWGVAAPHSVAECNGRLVFLARSSSDIGAVVAANGTNAQEISTPALRSVIDGYRTTVGISDAIGESFSLLGHTFYVLTFPAADATWVYDLTSQTWTEWLTWKHAEGRYAAWRPHWHTVAFGKHLIGDRETGRIYEIDPASSLDADGLPMRRLRRPPALWQDNARIFLNEFELLVEPGIGAVSVAPSVTLRMSRDLKTWRELGSRSVGATGAYRQRVTWNRLGAGRVFGFEVVCSDAYPYRLLGALVTPREGAGT